ncbi:glycosyltransferase [Oceanospirillaceae bacterium ASx5O]|nr:glycosyltransferase [Oceanospirillaceae bacterium ASx5O]
MVDSVDVVMATYNGELYLREQLDSILAQSYQSWRLLISDDGSCDSTLEILREYSSRDERIVIVNEKRQGGVINNFNQALMYSCADYIFLSDQDDVWLPNKIDSLLFFLKEKERIYSKETPILIFSDRRVVDESLNMLSESAFKAQNFPAELNCSKDFLIWRSTIYGCTTVFNKALYETAVPVPKFVPMHDQWLGLKAAEKGHVFMYDDVTILYRIHGGNVVGGKKKNIIEKIITSKKLFKKINTVAKSVEYQYIALYRELPRDSKKEMTFLEKLVFLKKHIVPFAKFSFLYSIFFSLCFISPKKRKHN